MLLIKIYQYWPEFLGILSLICVYFILLSLPSWKRVGLTFLMALLITASLYGDLGNPKPVSLQFGDLTGDLIGYRLIEGKRVYIYMGLDGIEAPQSLSFPWSPKLAVKLDKIFEESLATKQKMRISLKHKKKPMLTHSDSLDSADDMEPDVSVELRDYGSFTPKNN